MRWRLGTGTRIVLGAQASRTAERAALYLQREVERRSGLRWQVARGAPQPGDIVLGVPGPAGDGTLAGTSGPARSGPAMMPAHVEEIVLWCSGEPARECLYALAGSPGALMAAAGRLARTLELRPGTASAPPLSLRSRPAFPVRGHTFACHKQNTTYDKWEYAHWEEYLTELAAWGANVAILYPLHPARWAGSLPFGDGGEGEPWFDRPEREREFWRQWEIQRRLPALCHELGLRYGVWIPTNDVFPEEVKRHPELTKYGGAYTCVQVPEARRRIRAIRERLFAELEYLDVLFLPSRDDGGCPGCEQCNPWGPIYLELVQEQAALARRAHPACTVWLAQQGLTAAETEGLLAWLDRERPSWVEAVAFGPFSEVMTFGPPDEPGGALSLEGYARSGAVSGPVSRLRAAVPGEYRVILYPDEGHTFRCQYPVVTMDPVVQYVWGREDGPAPRPREMAALHAATCVVADGSIPYSEGNTDDVNKFVWSARDWDPSLTGEQIATEYARWFFGPQVATDAAALLLKIEEALHAPLLGSPAVSEARALVDRCESAAPELLSSWRWVQLRLGALMLDYLQRVVTRDRELAKALRYRVAAWRSLPDPVPGLKATIAHLECRFEETAALLREIVWTRDTLFAQQRLAVRGVAKLQHSYMRFDVLLERWREALARIERGELASFPARYAALVQPLEEAEESARLAGRGVPVVGPLQEFPWEPGASTWSWQ
jgi:hypothetical protein